MQGNWTVAVKSKLAAFPQQFIIANAITGNGVYPGIVGTSVDVTGEQWTIAIQNNPGTGFQLSDTQIKFPKTIGTNYVFDIHSNDAGKDSDFNDLVLTCSTPQNINDFIIYGNVSKYNCNCLFNPCRPEFVVIESYPAFKEALKNPRLKDVIKKLYPERIPEDIIDPNPPDPAPFKPIVIDLNNELMKPKTLLNYKRIENTAESKSRTKAANLDTSLKISNFNLVSSENNKTFVAESAIVYDKIAVASIADKLKLLCTKSPLVNFTLTFEEYDRTLAELSGGVYTGTGNRQILGDTITDMFGNYIFHFGFGMQIPSMEDATDIATGEDINTVAYPDIIVKITANSPLNVLYESVPYFNIPNLKRINLCIPDCNLPEHSACFNGNLIGSLGNVFVGGNQNSNALETTSALTRHGYNNYLDPDGIITVKSSLAGFHIDCACWHGTIDMKGCMYDTSKTPVQNKIKWYTIRIKRKDTSPWEFVSQNYKHPRFSKRHLPNYNGDDVGPFYEMLKVDGGTAIEVAAYKNIQREIYVDGVDWEFSNSDRYMQLNTKLYDVLSGVRTPGTFLVRVDGYDGAGNPVANGTDLIALYIHNLPLEFQLNVPALTDSSIIYDACGLYRLTDAQMNTPMKVVFKTNDPYGFVHEYTLHMGRCPGGIIPLDVEPNPPLTDTIAGATILAEGNASANTHGAGCPGYTGTIQDFSEPGLVTITLIPNNSGVGWIESGEYYTVYSFSLRARKRETNGYNHGVSDEYWRDRRISMERYTP